jgi:hypothetical protein
MKKSNAGVVFLKRRICAVKSVSRVFHAALVEFGLAGGAREQADVIFLGDDGDVLEAGGHHPLADFRIDQRDGRRVAEHFGVALAGDVIGPDITEHDGNAIFVDHFHFRHRHAAVELAGDGDHLVLRDQPLGA